MPRGAGPADAAADIAALDDAVGVTTSPLSTFGWIDWAARWWRRASARAVLLERGKGGISLSLSGGDGAGAWDPRGRRPAHRRPRRAPGRPPRASWSAR